LSVLVLRFQRSDQEYKTPLNLTIAGRELPIGLALTTSILFVVAVANLFSKRVATISGVAFMLVLFAVFTVSERMMRAKQRKKGLEQFNLDIRPELSTGSIHVRPGCILVAVRDYNRMTHLNSVLRKTNTEKQDIVVMTVRGVAGAGTGEYELSQEQLFTDYETELFTRVVSMAEKEGKHVELLVVPSVNPFDAMVQTAANLEASRLVSGVSARMASEELARRIGRAWEHLAEPRHAFSLEIISQDRPSVFFNLGPHPPRLWPEDIDMLHDMWLRLSERFGATLHHRDVVGVALRRMNRELEGADAGAVLSDVRDELKQRQPSAEKHSRQMPE
jgi:hypothetical protein